MFHSTPSRGCPCSDAEWPRTFLLPLICTRAKQVKHLEMLGINLSLQTLLQRGVIFFFYLHLMTIFQSISSSLVGTYCHAFQNYFTLSDNSFCNHRGSRLMWFYSSRSRSVPLQNKPLKGVAISVSPCMNVCVN